MKTVSLNLTLDGHSNRVLEVFKAINGYANKSEAANAFFRKFGLEVLEPELKDEVAEQLKREAEEYEKKYKFKRRMTLAELDAL